MAASISSMLSRRGWLHLAMPAPPQAWGAKGGGVRRRAGGLALRLGRLGCSLLLLGLLFPVALGESVLREGDCVDVAAGLRHLPSFWPGRSNCGELQSGPICASRPRS